jgi:hypothetical protein
MGAGGTSVDERPLTQGPLPAAPTGAGGGVRPSRHVFVDERGVRRRVIRLSERGVALAVAGMLAMGIGGALGVPGLPRLRLPSVGPVRAVPAAIGPVPVPQPQPTPSEILAAGVGSDPSPRAQSAPTPSASELGITVAEPGTSLLTPLTAASPVATTPTVSPTTNGKRPLTTPAGSPTTDTTTDPSLTTSPAPNETGQANATDHSQSRADPSPGPKSGPKS